jgi:hypothetical protein
VGGVSIAMAGEEECRETNPSGAFSNQLAPFVMLNN